MSTPRQQVKFTNKSCGRFNWDTKSMPMWVTIDNTGGNTNIPPAKLRVEGPSFTDQTLNIPAIASGTTHSLSWTMYDKQGGIRCAEDIQEDVKLTYYNPDSGNVYVTANYSSWMSFWTDKLRAVKPAIAGLQRFNIVIFGLFGAGKSSFINTLMTLMSDGTHVVTNHAMIGDGEEHTTTTLRKTNPVGDKGGWAVWDTFGLSEQTYKGAELKLLLEGLLADGFDLDSCENIVDHQSDLVKAKKSAHKRKQHACLFMFPYTLFSNEAEPDERIRDAKVYLKEFRQHGINPMVLITQADVIEPQLRNNAMGTYQKTEALRKVCQKHLGIPLAHIHLLVNYTTERERNFNIDRNTYRIVESALNRCVEMVATMKPASAPALDFEDSDDEEVIPVVTGIPAPEGRRDSRAQSTSSIDVSDASAFSVLDSLIKYAIRKPRESDKDKQLKEQAEKLKQQERQLEILLQAQAASRQGQELQMPLIAPSTNSAGASSGPRRNNSGPRRSNANRELQANYAFE